MAELDAVIGFLSVRCRAASGSKRPNLSLGRQFLGLYNSLYVGWSVTIVSPAETAELIKMAFGLWTRVDPRKHVLDGGSRSHGFSVVLFLSFS